MQMTAEELLKNHRKNQSKLQALEAQLEFIRQHPATEADRCLIEAVVLRTPALNGMPRNKNIAPSPTERVALQLDDLRDKILNAEVYPIEKEICRLRYHIHLFEAIYATLTKTEKWLVDTLYFSGKTQAEAMEIIPEAFHISSRSTLSRHKMKLLRKVDAFLQEVCDLVS